MGRKQAETEDRIWVIIAPHWSVLADEGDEGAELYISAKALKQLALDWAAAIIVSDQSARRALETCVNGLMDVVEGKEAA
jgi:hypothetical protein